MRSQRAQRCSRTQALTVLRFTLCMRVIFLTSSHSSMSTSVPTNTAEASRTATVSLLRLFRPSRRLAATISRFHFVTALSPRQRASVRVLSPARTMLRSAVTWKNPRRLQSIFRMQATTALTAITVHMTHGTGHILLFTCPRTATLQMLST